MSKKIEEFWKGYKQGEQYGVRLGKLATISALKEVADKLKIDSIPIKMLHNEWRIVSADLQESENKDKEGK